MMSDEHSTARSLARSECLNGWMTQLFGTLGFNHLVMAAEAELALLTEPRFYLGNKKSLPDAPSIALKAAHRASPTNGTSFSLPLVLSLPQGCGMRFIRGISSSRLMSVIASPTASPSLIPVSLNRATSQRISSSI